MPLPWSVLCRSNPGYLVKTKLGHSHEDVDEGEIAGFVKDIHDRL